MSALVLRSYDSIIVCHQGGAHVNAEEVIERIRRQRGKDVPEWTWLSRSDPEYMDAFNQLVQKAFGYYADRMECPDILPAKVKELLAIAVLAGQRDADLLRTHMRRAIGLGASDSEILETLQTSMALTGGPALRLGIAILMQLRAETAESGETTPKPV